MSFRSRLTLFFLAIVVVPMISVGVLVFVLNADNETGKTDARVAEAQAVARGVYREAVTDAATALRRVAADPALRQGGSALASTGKAPARPLPGVGTVSVGGTDFRVASFNAPGFGASPVRVSVLYDNSRTASAVSRSRLIVAAVLVGFLLLAC